jgi:ribosomal protein L37AE/L43A
LVEHAPVNPAPGGRAGSTTVKYTGENTMPVSTTATCPYCQNTDVRQTTDTGRIQAWSCDRCATDWAFTVQDTQGHRQSRGVMITSFLDRLVRRRGV